MTTQSRGLRWSTFTSLMPTERQPTFVRGA